MKMIIGLAASFLLSSPLLAQGAEVDMMKKLFLLVLTVFPIVCKPASLTCCYSVNGKRMLKVS